MTNLPPPLNNASVVMTVTVVTTVVVVVDVDVAVKVVVVTVAINNVVDALTSPSTIMTSLLSVNSDS